MLRFSDGNDVEVFDCGRDAFPRMLAAVEAARERVHVESYVVRNDRVGGRFLELLAERARQGVEVRLLFDAVGSRWLDALAVDALRGAGADVVAFNPLSRLYPHWAPRRRDHRKLLIVDGDIAFTGGLNLGDEYDAGVEDTSAARGWRDTHLAIRGPAVRDLGAVFLESWFRAGGTDLPWHTLLSEKPRHAGSVRCAVLPDGPVYRRRGVRDLLVSALDRAEETARFTSAYFAPDRVLLEALERTAERGVRVELILAGRTDHGWLRRASRASIGALLRRGVVVYEYGAAMLHAKSAVFDRRLAVVGSSNLDRQSLRHNYEVNLVFVGSDVPGRIDELFERDLARSDEVTIESLAGRSWLTRAIDALAAGLVSRLL